MRIQVELNGTSVNPFHALGLTQNPFPQIADYKMSSHLVHLQKLAADPIPDVEHIRRHLRGWSPEFIELCCKMFKPGEMVVFKIEFPD